MAEINRLARLFQAISTRDWRAAERIALELASAEERIGHHAAAQRLRGALRPNGHRFDIEGEAAQPTGQPYFLSTALNPLVTDRDLGSVRLKPATRVQLREVVAEWRLRDELARRGLKRRTKLLLHGPPGCGKSLTARALGRELGLPVYVVRFDAVVGAYLGQTALHLRQLFRFAEATPSVLLIDEIDALGKRRGSPLDVGELDRVVIALLQELEHSSPAGLLVATSNLASMLDEALWRRFDLLVEFARPNKKDLQSFVREIARQRSVTLTPRLARELAGVENYGDAERVVQTEERRLIIERR